jgi:hypothetical protein
MRGEGILTAIQRNTIHILRKIPNVQVTLMSGITRGLYSTLLYNRDISFWIFLSLQKKSFGRMEETISKAKVNLSLRPGRFTPGERAPSTHWIGGWVDPRCPDDVEKRKFLTLPGLKL